MERESIKQILSSHGLKVSEQRLQILDFLIRTDSHPTADEIFRRLTETDPVLSRATVYNTLNSFVETGVIHALDLRDNETRYDARIIEHGHFRCNICNRIYNFDMDDALLKIDLPGYVVQGHSLTLRGICPACQTKDSL